VVPIPSATEWIPILSGVSPISRLRRRILVAAPLVVTALFLLASPAMAASGSGLNPLLPNAVSPNGQALYDLYNVISIPALVVFLLVEALLLIIIVRDRRSRQAPDYRPPQWHGNRPLEIVWTAIPFVLLVGIGYLAFSTLQTYFQGAPAADRTLDVTVQGHQFGWTYTYPDGTKVVSEQQNADKNPLVVPTGTVIRMRMESIDVIHSWWVPELMGKTDLVPGYDNFTWFKVSEPGEWRGECAELCGAGHAAMQLRVRAVSPADFNAWMAEQHAKAATPSPSASPSPSARPSASPSPSPSASARPSPSPS
jgi:cytochrome c oxidase subunit II